MPLKRRFRGYKRLGTGDFALFLPNVAARLSWSPGTSVVERGVSLRSGFSVAIVALALAGSAYGAAAQYYPPPDYPPAPVPIYRDGPPVYRDARGVPIDPRYVQPAPGEEVYEAPPVGRPFFPPQPLPVVTGGQIDRPPSDVAAVPGSADVTGSVRGAAPMAPPRAGSNVIASLPPEDQPEQGPAKQLPERFRRQIVEFSTTEPAGTIIIDTPNTYLYFVLGNGRAIRYGVGVGREGFTWSGTERISRMKEWPDWFPPKEMIERQPYLPRFMAGGETNPLGARALYLGNTVYRIHGTNQPSTIGSFVSSGCIRLANDDVEDLYNRVNVGTHVVVLPGSNPDTAALRPPVAR
jgi:lipoprotein-anchoring transpeptidase ErfK/SrfK